MTVHASASKPSHLCSCGLNGPTDFLRCSSPDPFLLHPTHFQMLPESGPEKNAKQKLLGTLCNLKKEVCSNIKFLFLRLVFSPCHLFSLCLRKGSHVSIHLYREGVCVPCRTADFRRAEEMRTCPQEVCLHNRDSVFIYSALSYGQSEQRPFHFALRKCS